MNAETTTSSPLENTIPWVQDGSEWWILLLFALAVSIAGSAIVVWWAQNYLAPRLHEEALNHSSTLARESRRGQALFELRKDADDLVLLTSSLPGKPAAASRAALQQAWYRARGARRLAGHLELDEAVDALRRVELLLVEVLNHLEKSESWWRAFGEGKTAKARRLGDDLGQVASEAVTLIYVELMQWIREPSPESSRLHEDR